MRLRPRCIISGAGVVDAVRCAAEVQQAMPGRDTGDLPDRDPNDRELYPRYLRLAAREETLTSPSRIST